MDVDEFYSLMDGKLSVSDAVLDRMSQIEREHQVDGDVAGEITYRGTSTAGSVPVLFLRFFVDRKGN